MQTNNPRVGNWHIEACQKVANLQIIKKNVLPKVQDVIQFVIQTFPQEKGSILILWTKFQDCFVTEIDCTIADISG